MNRLITRKIKYLSIVILIVFISDISEAQQMRYHFQNSTSKAISMAGAFTAVQEFHNSLSWNAAGLILAKDRTKLKDQEIMKFNFDMLSVGIGFVALGIHSIFDNDDEEDDDDEGIPFYIQVFAYSFSGITFIDNDNFLLSLNLHEDLMDFETSFVKIFDNSYQSLIMSYKIGRELSIGTSISYYQSFRDGERNKGAGINLGLQYNSIKINGLNYGLSYFKFSNAIKNVRSQVERIHDNSLTFGIAYDYKDKYLISVDIKNINTFNKSYFCETHLGFEENIFSNLYLRQGFYFINNNKDKFVKAFGFGYRSKLFGISSSKNLDISIGALLNNNEPINRNEVSVTTRISF